VAEDLKFKVGDKVYSFDNGIAWWNVTGTTKNKDGSIDYLITRDKVTHSVKGDMLFADKVSVVRMLHKKAAEEIAKINANPRTPGAGKKMQAAAIRKRVAKWVEEGNKIP